MGSSSSLATITAQCMYRNCAELDMQHWEAQMQTGLDSLKPLRIVLFPFNPSVPNNNSLKGRQQSSSHPMAIFSIHTEALLRVSVAAAFPFFCGPKNQVCIRLLFLTSTGESASLQPPKIQQTAMFTSELWEWQRQEPLRKHWSTILSKGSRVYIYMYIMGRWKKNNHKF